MNVISAWVGKLKLNLVNRTAMNNGVGMQHWMNAASVPEAQQVFLHVNRIAMGTLPEALIRIIVVNVWKVIAGNHPAVRIAKEIGGVMRRRMIVMFAEVPELLPIIWTTMEMGKEIVRSIFNIALMTFQKDWSLIVEIAMMRISMSGNWMNAVSAADQE
jgi:hypothetical protein